MGKKGGSSWLTAVKRAFRSPTKESDKKSSRRREDHDQEEDEEKVFTHLCILSLKVNVYVSLSLDPFMLTADILCLWVLRRRERREGGYLGNPRMKKR